MKKVIKAAMKVNENMILDLLDEAVAILKDECDKRNQDEYVDDIKWGKDRFEIPIFIFKESANKDELAAVFKFVYDPENEDYSIEEQMHVQLDEFLQDWNREDDSEMTGEEYIDDVIDDLALQYMEKYFNKKSKNAIAVLIKRALEKKPHDFVEGEDFTMEDILTAMDGYDSYFEEYPPEN